jgi:hypothetical protein
MQARADRPGVVEDGCWVLANEPEQTGDQPWRLTPGTHTRARSWKSALCVRHGRGLAGHVSRTWGTLTRCNTHRGLVVEPQNHPMLRMVGFAEFRPQNSVTVVPEGTGGDTRRQGEECVKAKQLRVERLAVGSKASELVYFALCGVDRLYVNRVSLENRNNPL